MKGIAIFLVLRLPGKIRGLILKRWLGWEIHPTARIGLVFITANFLSMGAGSRLGHFTVLRNLHRLDMGVESGIGQWNWISSSPHLAQHANLTSGTLRLGFRSFISSRHYLDVSGGVEIGDFSLLAGVRSTILSHQIDLLRARQTVKPVVIGSHCFIGSDVKITPGAFIGDKIMIAMGAVVTGTLSQTEMIYAGIPARPVKSIENAAYFRHTGTRIGLDGAVSED